MEDDSKLRDPDFQVSAPPMPYPTQQPPPSYAQGVAAPVYQQPYYPNQYAPVPQQPMVYQPAPHVVTVGTAPPVVGPVQPIYSDYMAWSIVNIFCCCLPLGIAALIFSCKTQDAKARNDLFSARSHSSMARGLNITAMILGIFFYIFIIVYMVVIQQQFYNRHSSSTNYYDRY